MVTVSKESPACEKDMVSLTSSLHSRPAVCRPGVHGGGRMHACFVLILQTASVVVNLKQSKELPLSICDILDMNFK